MRVDRLARVWRIFAIIFGAGALVVACGGSEVAAPELNTTVPDAAPILAPVETVDPERLPENDTDPATLFVSATSGDDANDGQTPVTPWLSLQRGLDALEAGQTLYVMSGVYNEVTEPGNAHYVLSASGTEGAWIRIAAAPGEHPVIEASAGNGLAIRGSFVEVSGLEIQGKGFDAENAYGWGVLIRNAHRVRLAHNTISGMAVGGITSVESSNLEILYNKIHDNSFWGAEQGSGISFWRSLDAGLGPDADGYHDRIVGNVIYGNENKVFSRWHEDEDVITDGNGIILDTSDEMGYTGRTLVANNVVFDNGGRAILVLGASRVDVIFNTTYHNGRTGSLLGGPVEIATSKADDVRVFNNLAWSRSGVPAVLVDESTNVVMGGNVFITDEHSGDSTSLDLVTSADPQLTAPGLDPISANFRPTSGSLALGQAIPIAPRLPFDADGRPRSAIGSTVGAYELGSDGD